MKQRIWMFAGVLALAACATEPETSPDAVPGENAPERRVPDTCGAAGYAELLGQDAAAAAIVPDPKRVVGPGDIVTTDYLPNRVNIGLDATGTITQLGCG